MKFPSTPTILWLVLLCFCSCNSEDSSEGSMPSILGKWTVQSVQLQIEADINGDGVTTRNVLEDIPCYTASFNFQSNSNCTFEAQEVESSVIAGSSEIAFNCEGNEILSFLWRIEENQLILTNPENSSEIAIFEWSFNGENLIVYDVRTFQGIPADFTFVKN